MPEIADRVHATFADILDSAAGQTAQIGAASRILAQPGEHPDPAEAVRAHVAPLRDQLTA